MHLHLHNSTSEKTQYMRKRVIGQAQGTWICHHIVILDFIMLTFCKSVSFVENFRLTFDNGPLYDLHKWYKCGNGSNHKNTELLHFFPTFQRWIRYKMWERSHTITFVFVRISSSRPSSLKIFLLYFLLRIFIFLPKSFNYCSLRLFMLRIISDYWGLVGE